MLRSLALLRHGLAAGQRTAAALLPEGAAYLEWLGVKLAARGSNPPRILTSPYVRARASAVVLARALGCDVPHVVLRELAPESRSGPGAGRASAPHAPAATPVLVVAHMPLVGRLSL